MTRTLARHGTNAGYKAELATGNVCDRCRKAHNVYGKQYTRTGKAAGLKYGNHQVIDQLYQAGTQPESLSRSKTSRSATRAESTHDKLSTAQRQPEPQDDASTEMGQDDTRPSLGERLSGAIRNVVMPNDDGNTYVNPDDAPDYLHPIDPDPEPDGNWEPVTDAEFVINAAGMQIIQENMGTYLSIVGMTVEMIDPYCGPIIAENFDNMINRWSKVVAHYPKAAALFMNDKGGTMMAWIGAIQATWPVLYALYEHHLSKSVRVEKDGRVMRISSNGNGPSVDDATMPPMHDSYNYSAQ
jgi:hypothetical protein